MRPGIIQVYTGNGKGKTTAAIGLAVRAWGNGLKVKIFQFLKAPGNSGEERTLTALKPPLPVFPLGTGEFIINRQPSQIEIEQTSLAWEKISREILQELNDVIVIDELSHVINLGLLDLQAVLDVLKQKSAGLELILTGRDMPEDILAISDLITEMKMIKHPYQQGIPARKGIEY